MPTSGRGCNEAAFTIQHTGVASRMSGDITHCIRTRATGQNGSKGIGGHSEAYQLKLTTATTTLLRPVNAIPDAAIQSGDRMLLREYTTFIAPPSSTNTLLCRSYHCNDSHVVVTCSLRFGGDLPDSSTAVARHVSKRGLIREPRRTASCGRLLWSDGCDAMLVRCSV